MARTYGQSNSLGTQTGQPTSALPSSRARMLKALRESGRKKRPVYTAKPTAYPVGPPPVRPPADIDPQFSRPGGEPNLEDPGFYQDAPAVEDPGFYRDIPAITQPGTNAPIVHAPGIRYADDAETTKVVIGGKEYTVPLPRVPGPPPTLVNPGPAPIISEPGVQQSRNRGGQLAGAFSALAALMGGDPGLLQENAAGLMAQGITGGERGALDRYGREVNNYQQTAGSIATENANAQQDWQNQGRYADDLNQAQNAPQSMARQLAAEERLGEAERRRQRADTTKASEQGYKRNQLFAKRFFDSTPEARRQLLDAKDALADTWGIDDEEAKGFEALVNIDTAKPADKQKWGQFVLGNLFRQLNNQLISAASKEGIWKDIVDTAAEYGTDFTGSVDFLAMTPAQHRRLELTYFDNLSKANYRTNYLKYLRSKMSADQADKRFGMVTKLYDMYKKAKGNPAQIASAAKDFGLFKILNPERADWAEEQIAKLGQGEQYKSFNDFLNGPIGKFIISMYPELRDLAEMTPGVPLTPPGGNAEGVGAVTAPGWGGPAGDAVDALKAAGYRIGPGGVLIPPPGTPPTRDDIVNKETGGVVQKAPVGKPLPKLKSPLKPGAKSNLKKMGTGR